MCANNLELIQSDNYILNIFIVVVFFSCVLIKTFKSHIKNQIWISKYPNFSKVSEYKQDEGIIFCTLNINHPIRTVNIF